MLHTNYIQSIDQSEDAANNDNLQLDKLSNKDIKNIKQLTHWSISNLFLDNNKHLKIILVDGTTNKYIWCKQKLLYVYQKATAAENRVIVLTILQVLERGVHHEQITDDEANSVIQLLDHKMSTIRGFCSVASDKVFEENLDKLHEIIPIANGYKINILTKEKSKRTYHDYFTYELKSTYLSQLPLTENLFHCFMQSIFLDDNEYRFIKLLFGKFVLPDMHDNVLAIWKHDKAGGGKSVVVKAIAEALERRVVTIDKNVLLVNFKNAGFEIAKLRNRTICFIDEVAVNNDQSKSVPIDLARLQDLTGGGLRGELDKYQKAANMQVKAQTASIMALGNGSFFTVSNKTAAITRRIVFWTTQIYFRATTHPDYDPNDPFCKIKDPNIWLKLQQNKDHIFTWLINGAHDYLIKKQNEPNFCLISEQPQRFKDEWQALGENTSEFETTQFMNFITTYCDYSENNLIPMNTFIQELTNYVGETYNEDQFIFTQNKIKQLFKSLPASPNKQNPFITRPRKIGNNNNNDINQKRPFYIKHLDFK